MFDTQDEEARELGRLEALAERCAAEGQMNLNKLVEAAVYAQVRRAGWRFRPEVTEATMAAELEAGIQFLKQARAAPELVAALEAGQQALAEQRAGDLLMTEAPDVFVCRACGQVALGAAPEQCPGCGAWPGRFRKFVALFNGDNHDLDNPMDVLRLLARNAEDLGRLVGDLPEEATTRILAGSDWTIRDHVAHFAETQDMLDRRVELMLTQDNPDLVAVAASELAATAEPRPATTQAGLAAYRAKRAKCLARLEAAPLKDLWRSGRHPEFGQVSLLRQAAYIAFHEQTHLPEVEGLRQQVVSAPLIPRPLLSP